MGAVVSAPSGLAGPGFLRPGSQGVCAGRETLCAGGRPRAPRREGRHPEGGPQAALPPGGQWAGSAELRSPRGGGEGRGGGGEGQSAEPGRRRHGRTVRGGERGSARRRRGRPLRRARRGGAAGAAGFPRGPRGRVRPVTRRIRGGPAGRAGRAAPRRAGEGQAGKRRWAAGGRPRAGAGGGAMERP